MKLQLFMIIGLIWSYLIGYQTYILAKNNDPQQVKKVCLHMAIFIATMFLLGYAL